MDRLFAVALLLAASTAALADTVYMKDGRKFEGTVTDKGDSYAIKGKFGTIHVKKADVDRVDMPPTAEYDRKLAALDPRDADGLYKLGLWCKDKGMKEQAKAAFEKALAADANHEGAHTELGHAKIGDRWGTPQEMLESAEALVKLGKFEAARARLDPVITHAMDSLDKSMQRRAYGLMANLELRAGNKNRASDAIVQWAELAPTHEKVAAKARAKIVTDSLDGKFTVRAEDVAAVNMGSAANDPKLEAGRQPLWDERVMKLALRAEAGKDEEAGKKKMAEAEGLAIVDKKKALRLFKLAEDHFAHANEIVPNYGKQHQIECVRKMVPILDAMGGDALNRANESSPLNRKYEMQRNNVGDLKFTANGLKDFEEARRNWNSHVAVIEEVLGEIDRLNSRFPEELATQKEMWKCIHEYYKEDVPAVRDYFDTTAKRYK